MRSTMILILVTLGFFVGCGNDGGGVVSKSDRGNSAPRGRPYYDGIGAASMAEGDDPVYLDGIAPTINAGSMIYIKNADANSSMSGAKIDLVSNEHDLTITGAAIENGDAEVRGAIITIDPKGLCLAVENLDLAPGAMVEVFIDLSSSYTAETAFKVRGIW